MKTYVVNTVSSALLKAGLALTVAVLSAFAATQPVQAGGTIKPQNIVANGSFESGMSGWTATGSNNIASLYPESGSNYIVFEGDQDSTLSQTLQTVAGQGYTFSFYANDTDPYNTIDVLWNGQTIKGSPNSIPGSCPGDYIGYTFNVAATQATTALEFIVNPDVCPDFSNDYTNFRIDNVSVMPSGSPLATPEPSSLALVLIGALGLGGLALLRRKTAMV